MEFSEIFGFLKIWNGSIKVFLQNAKFMAFITILSLLPSSILFLSFTYLYQSTMTYVTNTDSNSTLQIVARLTLLFSVELIFLYAYIIITHTFGIATILASLSSYSPNKLSLQDLYTTFRAKWRSPIRKNPGGSRNQILRFLCFFAAGMAVPLVYFYPNPLAIAIVSVVWVSIFIFQLYESVVFGVAYIIPVVEDGCEGTEALEKAGKLVQGQRLHGFTVNLFTNLLWFIFLIGFWMIVGDQGSFNLIVYGLLFINAVSLGRIVGSVAYTVYYFQCMEYHDQKIHLLGNFQFHYTVVSSDIP